MIAGDTSTLVLVTGTETFTDVAIIIRDLPYDIPFPDPILPYLEELAEPSPILVLVRITFGGKRMRFPLPRSPPYPIPIKYSEPSRSTGFFCVGTLIRTSRLDIPVLTRLKSITPYIIAICAT